MILVRGPEFDPGFQECHTAGALIVQTRAVAGCVSRAEPLALLQAGIVAKKLEREFVCRFPLDSVFVQRVSLPVLRARDGLWILCVPTEEAEDLARAWASAQEQAGCMCVCHIPCPGEFDQRRLIQDNRDPLAELETPVLCYSEPFDCWDKAWFTDPADEAVLWSPAELSDDTVQGCAHRAVATTEAFYRCLKGLHESF